MSSHVASMRAEVRVVERIKKSVSCGNVKSVLVVVSNDRKVRTLVNASWGVSRLTSCPVLRRAKVVVLLKVAA